MDQDANGDVGRQDANDFTLGQLHSVVVFGEFPQRGVPLASSKIGPCIETHMVTPGVPPCFRTPMEVWMVPHGTLIPSLFHPVIP